MVACKCYPRAGDGGEWRQADSQGSLDSQPNRICELQASERCRLKTTRDIVPEEGHFTLSSVFYTSIRTPPHTKDVKDNLHFPVFLFGAPT